MIIQENDFIAESIGDDNPLFDLSLLVKVNAGKENEREEFKNVAYGIPMESVLKKVCHYRACKGLGAKENIVLKEYIERLHNAQEEIKKLVWSKMQP